MRKKPGKGGPGESYGAFGEMVDRKCNRRGSGCPATGIRGVESASPAFSRPMMIAVVAGLISIAGAAVAAVTEINSVVLFLGGTEGIADLLMATK